MQWLVCDIGGVNYSRVAVLDGVAECGFVVKGC